MDVKTDQHDYSVSLIRFVAMYSIVACHIFQYFDQELAYWLNTGVQLFLFISGWLYATKKIDKPIIFLKRTLEKLLFDYYIFLLIIIPVYFLFAPQEISIIQAVKLFLLRPRVYGLNHLWFMIYIVICYFLIPEIYIIANRFCNNMSREIALLVILCLFSSGIEFVVGIESAWINCFLIGYFMNRLVGLYSVKCLYLLMSILPLVALTNFYRISELGKNETVIAYSKVFLAVFIFLFLYILSKRIFVFLGGGRECVIRILKWTDQYSYDVYLVHHIFIIGPFSVFNAIKNIFLSLVIALGTVHLCAIWLNQLSNRIRLLIRN
ncbi:acyltransferase family protein [Clostridium sp.]